MHKVDDSIISVGMPVISRNGDVNHITNFNMNGNSHKITLSNGKELDIKECLYDGMSHLHKIPEQYPHYISSSYRTVYKVEEIDNYSNEVHNIYIGLSRVGLFSIINIAYLSNLMGGESRDAIWCEDWELDSKNYGLFDRPETPTKVCVGDRHLIISEIELTVM